MPTYSQAQQKLVGQTVLYCLIMNWDIRSVVIPDAHALHCSQESTNSECWLHPWTKLKWTLWLQKSAKTLATKGGAYDHRSLRTTMAKTQSHTHATCTQSPSYRVDIVGDLAVGVCAYFFVTTVVVYIPMFARFLGYKQRSCRAAEVVVVLPLSLVV